MATVTSFESLPMPGKTELKQFADLFIPLYAQSGEEARRLAVAALSQCETLPISVCQFIASQPIAVAAPFLTASPALDDETLIAIARTQGADHAKAIAARRDLSVKVVDALVNLHDGHALPGHQPEAPNSGAVSIETARDARRRAGEELIRQDLRARVMRQPAPMGREVREMRQTQEALLVRFARQRQAHEFATCLADMIGSSLWLVERIMLDLSGEQLATTLKASEVEEADALFVLGRFYPHLARNAGPESRAATLWSALSTAACRDRLDTWLRADSFTTGSAIAASVPPANHNLPDPAAQAIPPRVEPAAERRRQRVKAGSRPA